MNTVLLDVLHLLAVMPPVTGGTIVSEKEYLEANVMPQLSVSLSSANKGLPQELGIQRKTFS